LQRGSVWWGLLQLNVFISEEGQARIGGFHLSSLVDPSPNISNTWQIAGSLPWMAPEMLDGFEATVEQDVWAFAMTALVNPVHLYSCAKLNFHRSCSRVKTPSTQAAIPFRSWRRSRKVCLIARAHVIWQTSGGIYVANAGTPVLPGVLPCNK